MRCSKYGAPQSFTVGCVAWHTEKNQSTCGLVINGEERALASLPPPPLASGGARLKHVGEGGSVAAKNIDKKSMRRWCCWQLLSVAAKTLINNQP